MVLLSVFIILILYVSYKIYCHRIVLRSLWVEISAIRRSNSDVWTSSIFTILFQLLKFQVRNKILGYLQVGTLEVQPNKKYSIVSYYNGDVKYSILVPKCRPGPSNVDSIECKGKDITEDVTKYMGPYHNFHGIRTSPRDLGFDEVTVNFFVADSVTFKSEEAIEIKGMK